MLSPRQFAGERNRKKSVDMEESHQIIADDADVHGDREIGIHLREGLAVFFNVVIECCRSACLESGRRCLEGYVVAVKLSLK